MTSDISPFVFLTFGKRSYSGFTGFMDEVPNWNWNPKITEEILQEVDDQIAAEALAEAEEEVDAALERPYKVQADYMDDDEFHYFDKVDARRFILSYRAHNPSGKIKIFFKDEELEVEHVIRGYREWLGRTPGQEQEFWFTKMLMKKQSIAIGERWVGEYEGKWKSRGEY